MSEAERIRLERFEKTSEEMIQEGYSRTDLTVSMGKATRFSIILLIPLFIIGYGLYYLVNGSLDISSINVLLFIIVFVVGIVVHELIHGVCWSFFTPHHFKDVKFGVLMSSLTPYCTCLVPLKKEQHLFGTVMPLILLGIIPMAVGIAIGDPTVMFIGFMMAGSAAGDIMIIQKSLGYKSKANETVYMDHPTEAGIVVFER